MENTNIETEQKIMILIETCEKLKSQQRLKLKTIENDYTSLNYWEQISLLNNKKKARQHILAIEQNNRTLKNIIKKYEKIIHEIQRQN